MTALEDMKMEPIEVWRDVPGYEGLYQASYLGRVKRLEGVVTCRDGKLKPIRERVLRPGIRGAYLKVELCAKGIITSLSVHRLVCSAFHGEGAEGHEVNHRDSDKHNNVAANLEWVSRLGNVRHAHLAGRMHATTNPGRGVKLSQSDVDVIRAESARGVMRKDLARRFGVDPSMVSSVVLGKCWNHPAEYPA